MASTWNEDAQNKIELLQLGGVVVGNFLIFAPGSRIGHGTQIVEYVQLANNVTIGGNCKIGEKCFFRIWCGFAPQSLHA